MASNTPYRHTPNVNPVTRKYYLDASDLQSVPTDDGPVILYRVVRIADGHRGGFVQSESNLSHRGRAWIDHNAVVCDSARVDDDGWVGGNAVVGGNARVRERGKVYGAAWVKDDAIIAGDARVSGHSIVGGRAVVTRTAEVKAHAQVQGEAWIARGKVDGTEVVRDEKR